MIRKIIKIDKEKCNGCGACASACHEGAIEMVNGKAVLTREDYCDGLGDCLPACPVDAISFEMREAPAYDEAAVKASQRAKQHAHSGCPGSRSMSINHEKKVDNTDISVSSQLSQWPVQIKLVPVNAPYFDGANLLVGTAEFVEFAVYLISGISMPISYAIHVVDHAPIFAVVADGDINKCAGLFITF